MELGRRRRIKSKYEYKKSSSEANLIIKIVAETKLSIGMAKANFRQIKGILTNPKLNKETQSIILKCYMYSLLLYTCEPWIITERKKETEGNRNVVWQKNYEGPFKWQDRQITALVPGACLEERR